jgi:hypothetical protein
MRAFGKEQTWTRVPCAVGLEGKKTPARRSVFSWLPLWNLPGTENDSDAILAAMGRRILVIVAALLIGMPVTSGQTNKPTLSKTPLTAEELEVYGIFLDSFVGKEKESVNFSDRTFPLTLPDADNQGRCLEGIKLKNASEAQQAIHVFESSIADGLAIHLVDVRKYKLKDPGKAIKNGQSVGSAVDAGFQAGVLSVSEIGFDETHNFAVFKFSFICGSLCGYGGIVVFEKVEGQWKKSNRACPQWEA